ncbi:TatD family [Corchorus capsularis]|uniref:TatD family n=1 Tax=Corchorus capsularis TaxID=210143 RepID=A0A1R3KH50_COCAP|nr:TatD family [Corchorus capsularis]
MTDNRDSDSLASSDNPFGKLPDHLLVEIFIRVPVSEFPQISCVNKHWANLFRGECLWQAALFKAFPLASQAKRWPGPIPQGLCKRRFAALYVSRHIFALDNEIDEIVGHTYLFLKEQLELSTMPPPSGVLHGTIIDQFISCGKSRDIAHELASQIWLAVLDNLEENHHTFLLLKRLALEGDVFLPYPYSRSIKVQWRVFEKLFTDFRDCFNHSDYYDLLAMAKNKFQPIPSACWFSTLKEFFETTPSAAVGEIGLDKGSKGREIDFNDQIEVFRQQLELAKELKKPASIHCVRAFGDLLQIVKDMGPFPDGIILHSYLGSAEMVPEFAKSGAYFSLSGYVMPMKAQKAKKMLKAIPSERILLESDAPDALPNSELSSLFLVDEDPSLPQEFFSQGRNSASNVDNQSRGRASSDASTLPKEMLNHPANIHNVLEYVSTLRETSKEELAELSFRNAVRLFSYQGSKLPLE